nr:hypothetical protein [Tanacetum cinerariifolium]
MSKVLQEIGFGSLSSSTETNSRDHVKSVSTIVEADASLIRQLRRDQVNDLMPTIEEGEVVEEFRARNDARMNSNLIKEILASTNAAIRNQRASIKTLKVQIRKMSKVLQEIGFGSLSSSTETNSRDHVKSVSTIVEADASLIRRIGSHQYTVSTRQNSTLMYETRQMTIPFPSRLNDYYCEEKKGSYGP